MFTIFYADTFVYFTDTTKIVDMRNMIAVQDRDHLQIVANTEERIIDAKKNIMMNVTNIEVICLEFSCLFTIFMLTHLFTFQNLKVEENDRLGKKPEGKEVLKKNAIKKEDLDIKILGE